MFSSPGGTIFDFFIILLEGLTAAVCYIAAVG